MVGWSPWGLMGRAFWGRPYLLVCLAGDEATGTCRWGGWHRVLVAKDFALVACGAPGLLGAGLLVFGGFASLCAGVRGRWGSLPGILTALRVSAHQQRSMPCGLVVVTCLGGGVVLRGPRSLCPCAQDRGRDGQGRWGRASGDSLLCGGWPRGGLAWWSSPCWPRHGWV